MSSGRRLLALPTLLIRALLILTRLRLLLLLALLILALRFGVGIGTALLVGILGAFLILVFAIGHEVSFAALSVNQALGALIVPGTRH